MERFKAYKLTETPEKKIRAEFVDLSLDDLDPGDVVARVAYSDINYKDALAATGAGKILRKYPLNGGIDLSGEVTASTDARFQPGQKVLVTGCGHSESLDGGYAEYAVADARFAFPIPESYGDLDAAPLLCAGLIGYRALAAAGTAERIGLYGFGAAAHIVVQVARHQGRQVFAFTRAGDGDAQQFALALGAEWAGASDAPSPHPLDAAIIFAPVGALVPAALRAVVKGGTVVCAGIHMSDIPAFPYDILWGERVVRSVANLTRRDGEQFLALAPKIPVRTQVEPYPLERANEALERLRGGHVRGAAVLRI